MSISLTVILFQTLYGSKLVNSNVYVLGTFFSLISTAILLLCYEYQREKNVVFNEFKLFDIFVCIINFFVLLCCSTTLMKESNPYRAADVAVR